MRSGTTVQTRGREAGRAKAGQWALGGNAVAPLTGGGSVTYFDITTTRRSKASCARPRNASKPRPPPASSAFGRSTPSAAKCTGTRCSGSSTVCPRRIFEVTRAAFYARIHPEDEPRGQSSAQAGVAGRGQRAGGIPYHQARRDRPIPEGLPRRFAAPAERLSALSGHLRRDRSDGGPARSRAGQGPGGSGEQSEVDFLANISHEIRTPLNAIVG